MSSFHSFTPTSESNPHSLSSSSLLTTDILSSRNKNSISKASKSIQSIHKHKDLELNNFSLSCSSDLNCETMLTSTIGPGSPYRSSGSLNGLSSRPSLNKELVQKLRSMTETIKLLSDENNILRDENNRWKSSESAPTLEEINQYEHMTKNQLIAVTTSYQLKLAGLAEEFEKVKSNKGSELTPKSNSEHSKYKVLARRLKEERNVYKASFEEKENEQAVLKDEMDKMSEIISELRDNCHQLQVELSEVKLHQSPSRREAASQTNAQERKISNLCNNLSIGGVSESTRRARSVYSNRSKSLASNSPHRSPSKNIPRGKPISQNRPTPKIVKPVSKPISPKVVPTKVSGNGRSPLAGLSRIPVASPPRIPKSENSKSSNSNQVQSNGEQKSSTHHFSSLPLEKDTAQENNGGDRSADDEGSQESSVISSVPCTPRSRKKTIESSSSRRVQRTWKHFYDELEERKENPKLSLDPSLLKDSIQRKYSLPTPNKKNNHSKGTFEGAEEAVALIQASILAHNNRSNTLMKDRIVTARPWLKNRKGTECQESSEEELDHLCHQIQGIIVGHETRTKALEGLSKEFDLFTAGKVSALKAKFNDKKICKNVTNNIYHHPERSDGVTDDDT